MTTPMAGIPLRRRRSRRLARHRFVPTRVGRLLIVTALVLAGLLQLSFSVAVLWSSFTHEQLACHARAYRDPVTGRPVREAGALCANDRVR